MEGPELLGASMVMVSDQELKVYRVGPMQPCQHCGVLKPSVATSPRCRALQAGICSGEGGEHLLFLFPGCQPWARGAKDVEVGQNGAAHTVALGARGAAGELGAELPQEQGAVLCCHQSRVK